MHTALLKQLLGYTLFIVGFLILYFNFFIVRQADELYGIAAGVVILGGLGLITDNSSPTNRTRPQADR